MTDWTNSVSMKRSALIRIALLAVSIVGISLLHYLTPLHLPVLHDIFQRLYYIPIIFAAFWFGLRGGLSASIIVSVLYAPHILFQWGIGPSLEMEKFLEIVLYNVVGGITGFLSQREEERQEELRQTASGLEESYRKLQSQADLIIGIEEQLRKAERLSVLGELSAVLAHEIRNPLGSIRGTAEILKDDIRPGGKKYEFLEILLKETDRLNRVVEDFLNLARPLQVERGTCDLMAGLGDVVALVSAEAASRGGYPAGTLRSRKAEAGFPQSYPQRGPGHGVGWGPVHQRCPDYGWRRHAPLRSDFICRYRRRYCSG